MSDTTVEPLKSVFVTAYAAYYNAQTAHWHVTGPRFHDLHVFFNEEYDWLADEVDTIAEHIRMHQETLPTSLRALAALTPEVPEADTGSARITLYQRHLLAMQKAVKSFDEAANKAQNTADIDLAGEIARLVEKSLWKVRSLLAS